MNYSSRRSPIQPGARLFPPRKKPPRKVGRYFALGIVSVIAMLSIYHLSAQRGVFQVKRISVSGGDRYTQNDIIAALGFSARQRDVHTISEHEIADRLKRKLSYIKQADISKSIVKRSLTIQITERKPVALLKYVRNHRIRFVLVDLEGYVLEYINLPQAPETIVTIIGDGQQLPMQGDKVHSDEIQLALKVLRSVHRLAPEIVSTLHTIDANHPDKITLQFHQLPVAWLSSDLIETGIRNIGLFVRNQARLVKQEYRRSGGLQGYLDARFDTAIYWGGK